MDYKKGEQAILYTEFKYDEQIVLVDNAQVRILHECSDNKVYEDLPWQNMKQFNNGYIYTFDTNICNSYGTYVAVYQGYYRGQKLNIINKFNLIITNQDNTENGIKIYGFINDINSNRLIKDVKVKIFDININDIIYQTISDEDGQWMSYILSGEYQFIFEKEGYETREIRAQVNDETSEVQFNNVALEKLSDRALGNGLYCIEDSFTRKDKSGIANINLLLYDINNLDEVLLNLTTDNKGKWKAFLDDGTYIMKLISPSGEEKLFKLTVYNNGTHNIDFYDFNSATATVGVGEGSETVTDYIINANGKGIEDVTVDVYQEDKLIATTTTDVNGQFTFMLDKGKYKFIINDNSINSEYKSTEQIINI